MENVQAEVCQECGERYFHARTLDTLDALIQGDHEVKQVLSVGVLRAWRGTDGAGALRRPKRLSIVRPDSVRPRPVVRIAL